MNQISIRAYIDIEVSKYYKICLGENCILAMGVIDIQGKFQKNCKIENFEGSSIWLKEAWDWEY